LEKGQTFDPNFSVPSVREGGMVSRSGAIIKFDDVAVQQFGCLHKSKIAELKLLLQNSKPLKSNVADDLVQRELGLLLQDLK
jgi:hypothetical protein